MNTAIYKWLGKVKIIHIQHYANVKDSTLLKTEPWGFKPEEDRKTQKLPVLTKVAENKRNHMYFLSTNHTRLRHYICKISY